MSMGNSNDQLTGARSTSVERRISTETKASFKTTELIAYVAAVVGVLIAAATVDGEDFGAQDAWLLITILTVGYMVSRGLAKSGSRDFYTDTTDATRH
jgi:di/tricarboxylate transporter